MHGLELVNDQLEVVARGGIDWSRHQDVMDGLDAELAQLHQRIKTVISLHEFVIELDDICARDIEAGKKAPSFEAHGLLDKAISLFRSGSAELISQAGEFTRKGIPVSGVGLLRKIAADPGAGLRMAEMYRAAQAYGPGGDQPPAEIPFDEPVFNYLDQQENPHRKIG